MVAITPIFISALMTSALRSAMRLASSCTVIVSGTTTSRTILVCSCSICSARCFSRSRVARAPRRGCAGARLRPRSAPGDGELGAARRGSSRRGAGAGRLAPAPRPAAPRRRLFLVLPRALTLPAAVSAATLAAAALPARSATSRRESSSAFSALRRASSSALRRDSSSVLCGVSSSACGAPRPRLAARLLGRGALLPRAGGRPRARAWRRLPRRRGSRP